HLTGGQGVAGSNPVSPTIFHFLQSLSSGRAICVFGRRPPAPGHDQWPRIGAASRAENRSRSGRLAPGRAVSSGSLDGAGALCAVEKLRTSVRREFVCDSREYSALALAEAVRGSVMVRIAVASTMAMVLLLSTVACSSANDLVDGV